MQQAAKPDTYGTAPPPVSGRGVKTFGQPTYFNFDWR